MIPTPSPANCARFSKKLDRWQLAQLLPKIAFSTSLERVEHNARLVHGDVAMLLRDLPREFDDGLDVSGPNLAGQFIRRGLVDEYRLIVHPVVLSARLPFWPEGGGSPIRLRLVDTRRFASGAELRSYVPAQPGASRSSRDEFGGTQLS